MRDAAVAHDAAVLDCVPSTLGLSGFSALSAGSSPSATVQASLPWLTQDELPDVEVSATPYGLTAEQVKQIKSVYYDGFHFAREYSKVYFSSGIKLLRACFDC